MILLWLILWFWYDFDMVLIWLIFRALTLSQEPYVFSHPHHNNTKGPISDPELRYGFFLGPSFLRVWAPRPHACYAAPRTNTEPRSPRSSRILNPGIWTAVILSHKHRKIKSYSSYLCIFHSRLTRIIPVRPCRLFLGSLGTSLWEAWEGEKGAGQLTRMSLILTLGLTCPFSEQNGAKWYWKLTSEWLTASD